jgi:hypothetical protein
VFYDVPSKKWKIFDPEIEIAVTMNKKSLAHRLWEIQITQIPFGSKSPTGCMQYHEGTEGKIQRFY